jgi:formylglycine-generating enzyme required for sulfatase activity
VTGADFRLASGKHLGRTTPVGQYPPNQFGLYDMHGNLFQWREDRYEPYQEELRNPDNENLGHAQLAHRLRRLAARE